ncbi:MAG: hypothetical protein ABWX96_04350 [Propionibacteriaceae bacterium]
MIPIAGVLLLIIIVFTVAVIVSNPDVFNLSIFNANIPVTTAGVYFTGAGAMLVLILAADLLRRGLKRERARRKQVRALQTAAGVKKLPTNGPAAASRKATQTVSPPSSTTHSAPAVSTSTRPPAGDLEQPAAARPASASSTAQSPETSAAERQALLDEAEELTGDSADR